MDTHQSLIIYLNRITELSASDEDELREAFVPQSIKKGDYLNEYNKVSTCLAFVCEGYFRVYIIDPNGNEVTIHIAGNVDFVGAISSFLTQKPSEDFVQAVTDTEILCISFERLQLLYKTSPTWQYIGRRIMEGLFLRKQSRVISLIKYTPEERYLQLMEQKPDLVLHVPMLHIASFIGIAPETLSRIRARIT